MESISDKSQSQDEPAPFSKAKTQRQTEPAPFSEAKTQRQTEPAPFSEAKTQQVVPVKPPAATPPKTLSRSSSFKYYIHDRTDVFRLQLIGELTEAEVGELNGCWRTAKTTLADRKLLLDLRGLKAVDDAGKQWLASMSSEGASYQPESYLKTCLAGQSPSPAESENPARKTSLFSKVIAALRGLRVSAAESSTQAP